MPTPDLVPREALRAEILAEAGRESEAILRAARQEAQAILDRAEEEGRRERQERLDQAQAAAARRRGLLAAAVAVETGRLRSARVERLLDSVREEARRRLAELVRGGAAYREAVLALAAEAVGRMAGASFVVKLSPADRSALGEGLGRAVAERAGRGPLRVELREEAALAGGGVVVEDESGRQVWDERLPARLERLWPQLRRRLAARAGLAAAEGRAEAGP
jgi:vacuolar-type H+-ATPase subunit E/Vma4